MRRPAALLLLATLALGACGQTPAAQPVSTPARAVASVEARGGECPQGMCSTRYEVFSDGRVVRDDGATDAMDAGIAARLTELVEAADWDAILARPFTGECPTAYDGQELVYTFWPGAGEVTVASCSVQVDPGQEPFATIDRVLFGGGE
jgi:hypothetical protein